MKKSNRIFNQAKKTAEDYSFFEKMPILMRMINSWRKGLYKPKKRNLIIAILALIYTISPLDFDWAPIVGWLDDAAILAYAFSRIMGEVDRFIQWENTKTPEDTIDTIGRVVD